MRFSNFCTPNKWQAEETTATRIGEKCKNMRAVFRAILLKIHVGGDGDSIMQIHAGCDLRLGLLACQGSRIGCLWTNDRPANASPV